MIRRLYANNFRCLENFELVLTGSPSVLLIGNNGAGKTTVGRALTVLQQIARGTNRIRDLVTPGDFTRGRTDRPMRFELEIELSGLVYAYSLAFEYPKGFKELRVFEERLTVDGAPIYSRELANVRFAGTARDKEAGFTIDWHLVALPIIQQKSEQDPLSVFKRWLAQMLILEPIPGLITGDSNGETLEPTERVLDFGAWFAGILAFAPASYSVIADYLRQVLPDLKDIRNPLIGPDARSLVVQFANEQGSVLLPFKHLSDGEKCFMICALVLATRAAESSTFCFWDEPDNFLALSEVGHFIVALRKAFQHGGQFIATSHNPEAIRRFSADNTLILYRKSHLEPTQVRPLADIQLGGDLIEALIRGDVEP